MEPSSHPGGEPPPSNDDHAPAPPSAGPASAAASAEAHRPALDLQQYAAISAELVIEERAAVLARHGLDEEAWERVEDAWQARLSEELEAWEEDGVPPLLAELEAAQAAARARVRGDEVLPLERFAAAVREMGRGGDPVAALTRAGVSNADFTRASALWTGRMATDPALAARFAEIVGGRRP